jgi:hypothetical protein
MAMEINYTKMTQSMSHDQLDFQIDIIQEKLDLWNRRVEGIYEFEHLNPVEILHCVNLMHACFQEKIRRMAISDDKDIATTLSILAAQS